MNQQGGRPVRVLVVEDDRLSRVLIEEALSDLDDVELTTATTITDGVLLLSSQIAFDLLLLDWRLDGLPAQMILDVASSLRPGRRPHVVLVTGSILPEEITSLVPTQIDRILLKPIELDELIDVVISSSARRADACSRSGYHGESYPASGIVSDSTRIA